MESPHRRHRGDSRLIAIGRDDEGGGSMKLWCVLGTVCAGLLANMAPCTAALAADEEAAAKPNADAAAKDGAPKPDVGEPKPFNEVIKGATEHPGYFTAWEKEGKVWIEVPDERLEQPFFFEGNVSNSLGERGAYASQMGTSAMAVFRRVRNSMQLIAVNAAYRATPGTPAALAVRQSFSDSLIGSAPVMSKRDPERKSVLVDAGPLLLRDILGYSTALESSFRLTYALDAGNSSFSRVRIDDQSAVFSVLAHFSIARLPGFVSPENKFPPQPPRTVPDPRSFFVGFVYSFVPLPAEPMRPRPADDRIGYFQTSIGDYSNDDAPNARVHYITRWRLEKKDPAAALSEPKQPIVFWIDRNVPERYRQAIIDGILEWNKAFERVGFRDAIVARIQPDNADFDTLDARHASVRWFVGVDVGFAIGPSVVDPRTGEILDADIGLSDAFTRRARQLVSEELPPRPGMSPQMSPWFRDPCAYERGAADELGFGLDLLAARTGAAPDGPEADRFALQYLKDVVAHEVGHTLGLRHNFHASTIRSSAQLDDAAFTREHGLAGSVMDYLPINIAPPGTRQGEYVMSSIGPYDYWAIEYGYRPIEPAQEAAELERIAGRSTEPELVFATDEDASAGADGADPEINRFDLGSEPLAYYQRRFELSRELWDRMQSRPMQPGENYLVLRRNLERGFRQIERAAPLVAKYIGGVHTTRDHAGTGRALTEPVAAATQKQALTLLARELFAEQSFRFKPEFLGRVGIDYLDREQPEASNTARFELGPRVLKIQKEVLDHVLSDEVAARMLSSEYVAERPGEGLRLAQLYDQLQGAIWSELDAQHDIPLMRRNLQREHLKHLVAALLKPAAGAQADVHSLSRVNALKLRDRAQHALAGRTLSPEARAHLQQTVAMIDDGLKATPVKAGP
jgi:hypothetical protein